LPTSKYSLKFRRILKPGSLYQIHGITAQKALIFRNGAVGTSTLEKAVILNFEVLVPDVLEIKLINWCNRLAQM
jgi:hypothetical protein